MSRTIKDKPKDLLYGDYWNTGDKPKVPKFKDSEWHWVQSTPSWWNHLYHTKPIRARCTIWEHDVVKASVDELDDIDPPNISNKPHRYYW